MQAFAKLKKVKKAMKMQSERRYVRAVFIISTFFLTLTILTLVPFYGPFFYSLVPALEIHICYRMIVDYGHYIKEPIHYSSNDRAYFYLFN